MPLVVRSLSFFLGALLLTLVLLAVTVAARAEEPIRLLALGDSLIHGYGLPAGETFPEQLEAALREKGHEVEVLNAGNSGDTTAAGLARLDWALADDPDAVLVEFGGNDGLRGIDPADTRRNMDQLIGRLVAKDIPVLLAGMMAPRNLGADYAEEFDSLFPEVAEKHGVLYYPFFLEGVAAEPALNQDDGIHPNREGVALIVEKILPVVEALLGEVRAQQEKAASG